MRGLDVAADLVVRLPSEPAEARLPGGQCQGFLAEHGVKRVADVVQLGVLSQNRRNFRHPSSSPATSASRSIILPSLWKV
jgi:hypothetical protein